MPGATLLAVEPEHGADGTQRGEATRGHLAQLDVAHRMSPGAADHVGRGHEAGPPDLHRLQLGPTPQQRRFHQLGVDGGAVGDRLTVLLKGGGETGSQVSLLM